MMDRPRCLTRNLFQDASQNEVYPGSHSSRQASGGNHPNTPVSKRPIVRDNDSKNGYCRFKNSHKIFNLVLLLAEYFNGRYLPLTAIVT